MSVFDGRIDQKLDVQGSNTKDQAKTLANENTGTGAQTSSGSGNGTTDNLAFAANVVTMTVAGAFAAADLGRFITLSSSANGGNDGTFLIEEYVDANTVKFTNAAGVAEANYAGDYVINDPYSLEDDLNFERTDRKLIKGTTNYYDAVPTYQRPSAIGTDIPKNLTNLLSVDAYTRVRDVRAAGVTLRPSITDGDATLAIGDETFVTTGFHFVAGDLDSFITISGSTDADGTYRIKAVTDGQTLELDGLSSATAEGAITWVLEGDLKGILSARSYADAVDRRGIPIADAGAYDQTNYEATFVDVIDPATVLGIEEEDGDRIWGRSFGDAADPNNTGTNEGTRLFVQLYTGDNDAGATASLLEPIAGRSGSAASLAGGNTNISGLTGMVDQDVGNYISIWNLAADEAGHYLITAIVSATEVTVSRGGNFTADASGAIEWQVSRHPGTFDFYHGDRYLLSELSETAGRTTLISGIVADASLSQAIKDLQDAVGVDPGDNALTLTNTGNYYVWSDLDDTNNTSVTEALNELNEQIGDRDYTGTILTDGLTITASLQELADAIAAVSIVRVIERLVAAVPKNTVHSLPGTYAYTVDGTFNGANMFVFWRKQLRDPGVVANGDDYDETSGGTPGVVAGTITPYEVIKAGDHINYLILQ